MKKILLVGIVLLLAFVAGCQGPPSSNTKNEGRLVYTITDAAANMNNVEEVRITVDEVRAHSASEGWVTLESESQTYNLMELKAEGRQAELVDEEVDAVTYDQVELMISRVQIVEKDGSTEEAKMPSDRIRINNQMRVEANSTTAVTYDFELDKSLHVTGNGKYVMAPVIHLTTREDATVDTRNEDDVDIAGGSVTGDTRVGMDLEGNVGVGVSVPVDAIISISGNNLIALDSRGSASGSGRVLGNITGSGSASGGTSGSGSAGGGY